MSLEKTTEQRLVRDVRDAGGLCLKLELASGRGFPDRTILLPHGQIYFAELKSPSGVLSWHQKHWIDNLTRLGFECQIIR